MRMWMCLPELLCTNHLSGEFKELFMFVGTIKRGIDLRNTAYVHNGLVEVHNIRKRYRELKAELTRRAKLAGRKPVYKALPAFKSFRAGNINVEDNLNDLMSRCPKCRENIINHFKRRS